MKRERNREKGTGKSGDEGRRRKTVEEGLVKGIGGDETRDFKSVGQLEVLDVWSHQRPSVSREYVGSVYWIRLLSLRC